MRVRRRRLGGVEGEGGMTAVGAGLDKALKTTNVLCGEE